MAGKGNQFRLEAERLETLRRENPKAVERAAGTLHRRLPVAARRDIQAEYNLTAARIRAGLSTRRGRGFVELTGSKRGIGLINFGGRWGGRKTVGAVASRRKGQVETYPDSFIATMLGGHRQIAVRDFGKRKMRMGRYAGTPYLREPLKVLYGPSIAHMLRNPERRERMAAVAQEVFTAEMARLQGRAR